MLLSLFQMSVTSYWDGAACVDWVQGCSAEFVSMLEDTYTNEVLAEPLSADLNGDFMAVKKGDVKCFLFLLSKTQRKPLSFTSVS